MKKLLLLLASVGMIFTACEAGGDVEEENGGAPSTPKIELSQQSIEVEFEPAKYEIAVTSPYSWEAKAKNDWIEIETRTGIAGTKMLKFSVTRNEEKNVREGTIVVKNDDYNLIAELYVIQKKVFVPEWSVSPESLNFTFEGGTQDVAITANFEYEFSTKVDWLTIEKSESAITVTAKANANFEERAAEITISNNKHSISKTISVVQKGVSAKPENVIIYTSSDGKVITPYNSSVFGANIISNIYSNGHGQGIIIFDTPVTEIGEKAFEGCTSLKSITIPNSVTWIGDDAFSGCTSLTSITIPNSVTSIGYNPFRGCTSLPVIDDIRYADTYLVEVVDKTRTSYAIKPGTRFIGSNAFRNCTSLTSFTIPDSVTSIGGDAFIGCTSLTSVTIPDSVTKIGDWAFFWCTSLTSVTIGNSVTSIGDYAFYKCSSLTSVTIGNGVTSIGDHAFRDCTSLTSITIPNSVTEIGNYAFSSCTSLTSITIPDSVTEIGESAFYNCTSLTSVYCKPETPPTPPESYYYRFDWGETVTYDFWHPFLRNASGRKIYVPRASVEAYKQAEYWKDYANDIVGYDF